MTWARGTRTKVSTSLAIRTRRQVAAGVSIEPVAATRATSKALTTTRKSITPAPAAIEAVGRVTDAEGRKQKAGDIKLVSCLLLSKYNL
jgi:hypothetical protein